MGARGKNREEISAKANGSTALTVALKRSRSAKKYSAIKYTLSFIEIIYLLAFLFLFQASGLSRALAEGIASFPLINFFIIPLYIFIIYIIYCLFSFPINFYHSFILEKKFCLTGQKLKDWVCDEIKEGIIFYIILLIAALVFYVVLKYNPDSWWLIISGFWIFFSLILAKLTPVIIIPLFFKYKRLSDEALRQRIINLADKINVKILDVFEIDLSKKTLKANAAFVGLGRTKRVILADTLKDKYSYDEIEVILAHEFAHYKLRHLVKLIFINSLTTILAFYFIFKTSNYALRLFGLSSLLELAALPIIIMYFVAFGIIMQPFQNYISRVLEKNADKAALAATGLKEAFVSMMEKMSQQNLADRNPSAIIKFFFFDHPPVDERIALAKSWPLIEPHQ